LPSISLQPVPSRALQLLRFFTGFVWLFAAWTTAAHAAQGIATRFNLPVIAGLLNQGFFLLLLVVGFSVLQWLSTRTGGLRSSNGLPSRPSAPEEFKRGAALGWAMLLVAVIPLGLIGALHPAFSFVPSAWGLTVISLLTLLIGALATEVAFRGYLFLRLIDALGPTLATLLLSFLYAAVSSLRPSSTPLSVFIAFVTGILFAMAYLRTHGLWLGWGLHFAWNAATAVLFGLPVTAYTAYSTVVTTSVTGSAWFTGGDYGPEAAFFTLFIVLAAMVVLFRLTRDYAWNYTHAPIVAAAYEVVVTPPAAHAAMEASAAAAPAPLVQILTTTPTASSTLPIIDEHLRRESDADPAKL
jgi:membrane protease YdiL (CAAX protease family)